MTQLLLTLGNGTATEDELARLIREAAIESIIDVRTVPKSRRHPHFWREEMERWVPEQAGSTYLWEPALGGFRKGDRNSSNVAFAAPLIPRLCELHGGGRFHECVGHIASPNCDCSRRNIVLGNRVVALSQTLDLRRRLAPARRPGRALMHDGKLRPHISTAGVRVFEAGKLRYDVLF
jgi:hypothetical protein